MLYENKITDFIQPFRNYEYSKMNTVLYDTENFEEYSKTDEYKKLLGEEGYNTKVYVNINEFNYVPIYVFTDRFTKIIEDADKNYTEERNAFPENLLVRFSDLKKRFSIRRESMDQFYSINANYKRILNIFFCTKSSISDTAIYREETVRTHTYYKIKKQNDIKYIAVKEGLIYNEKGDILAALVFNQNLFEFLRERRYSLRDISILGGNLMVKRFNQYFCKKFMKLFISKKLSKDSHYASIEKILLKKLKELEAEDIEIVYTDRDINKIIYPNSVGEDADDVFTAQIEELSDTEKQERFQLITERLLVI